jgi:hypothetical protein
MKPSVVVALIGAGSVLGFMLGFVVAWFVFKHQQDFPDQNVKNNNVVDVAEEARKSTARIQVKTLTLASQHYELNNLKRPETLRNLLLKGEKGGPYLTTKDAIMDPWGREFQFNPEGTRNQGITVDVWCVAPDGTEIGNWQSQEKK